MHMLFPAEIFFNSVNCTQFTQRSVGLGMQTLDIHFQIFLVCIYTGKIVTEYEGIRNIGIYYF